MKNYNKKFLCFFVVISLFLSLFIPLLARAEDGKITLDDELEGFRTGADLGDAKLGLVIGKVVKGALSILGLVALVIFIIAGFQWMTSGGNKEKIQSAQKLMGAAVIGLVIVIIAYAAAHFIINALSNVTQ